MLGFRGHRPAEPEGAFIVKLFSTAVLALSLTSINPATAAAGVGEDVKPHSETSASTSAAKSVTVTCPNGWKVVGAGGAVTGDRTAITRIKPTANLGGVEVHATEFGSGTPLEWTVTARANCAPGEYSLVSKNGAKTAEASCPTGTKSLGVGAEIVDLVNGVHLTHLAPQSDLKGAKAEAKGPAGTWSVTAYAICGKNPGAVLRTSGTSVVITPNVTKFVACQGDEKVISAGGSVAGKAIIGDVLPHPSAAVLTGQTRDAQTQQIRWSITPYAVCSP